LAVLESAEFHDDFQTIFARSRNGRGPDCCRNRRLQWRWKLACAIVILAYFSNLANSFAGQPRGIVVGHSDRFVRSRADDMVAQSVRDNIFWHAGADRQRQRDERHRLGIRQRVWKQHHVFAVSATGRR